ncbi:putative Ig domain-containing protein, partial [Pseudoscardovia radai]|uniref:putative Ig domain-containing protein n=1 Tax=Pseudoscardovia radai TaxID=987066 RepID=UPI0039933C0C
MKPHRKIVLSRTVGAFVAAVVSCSAGVLALPAHAEDTNDNTTVQTPTTNPTTPTANPTTPTADPTTEAPASPLISTDSLPKATYNTAYNTSVKAENFTGNATFTAEGLPAGLTIEGATGVISGTPAKSGSYTVKVTAKTDDNTVTKSYALFVYEAPVLADENDGTTLPTGEVNKAYSYQFKLSTETYDTPTFSAEGLPKGLSIDAKTGVISGTPTEYGSFTPKITLTNEGGTLTLTPSLTVDSPLSLDQTELAPAKVGDAYSAKLTFKGNPAASSSSVTGLPAGLDYDPATGTIFGTPTASGVFELTVAASNGVDPAVSTKLTLTVNAAPVVNTAALADATYAVDYSQKVDVAAYPAAKVEVSGLPEGLAYNAATGAIEGKPAVAGEFTVTVKASNDYG